MKTMKSSSTRLTRFAAVAACLPVALLVTSCSTTPKSDGPSRAPTDNYDSPNFGGEVVTEAVSTTATVVSVDRAKRVVVVKRADGRTVTYRATPNAVGLDVIQPGDVVKLSVAEELAVFMGKNSVPPATATDSARLRVKLPGGTQAVATEVAALTFTAKVIALDNWQDTVTLQLPSGLTKTLRVSEFVNLADYKVGDAVSVRITEAAVLVLEKP